MKTGIELIAEERESQIRDHDFTLSHDQQEYEKYGSVLPEAALFLLTDISEYWPKHWEQYWKERLEEKTEIERLAVAGALIAAEIDRLSSLEKEGKR